MFATMNFMFLRLINIIQRNTIEFLRNYNYRVASNPTGNFHSFNDRHVPIMLHM